MQKIWIFSNGIYFAGPALDAEDLAYTREVLIPYLDAEDMRTAIECLFEVETGRTLGFTPISLSPWARPG